jgi:hypothetical protein
MLFRVNWQWFVKQSAKSLPFYLLVPGLLVGIPLNVLLLVSGNMKDFRIANTLTLGAACIGFTIWLLITTFRALGVARRMIN